MDLNLPHGIRRGEALHLQEGRKGCDRRLVGAEFMRSLKHPP